MLNMAKKRKEGNLVQSVGRALDILEELGQAEGRFGVTELARKLSLKVPTVHNLLRTLAARGYVVKDRDQRYRLGFGCAQLGRTYLHTLRIPEAARPAIERLALRLNESVVVAAIEQNEIVFVARATGNQMLTVNFERSFTRTGYGSVCGRVILAHLPPAELEGYIATHPIAKGRVENIRNRKDLDRILRQARRNGHLEYWREKNTVLAIAAPIRNYAGDVVAAVGVGMPGIRFKKTERKSIVKAVEEAARTISSELGYAEQDSPKT